MRQTPTVKVLVRIMVCLLLFGPAALSTHAAFSALYAFGDGVCTTTGTPAPPELYYGDRYCNGRVWVEVLAQRQGLTYDASKNLSYFGQYSSDLVSNVNKFSAPANVNTSLFVVWVSDADFVWDLENIYPSLNLSTWNNAISSSLANHLTAIQTLYAKGARTLIMPNAVDITEAPQYSNMSAGDKSFVLGRVAYFNFGFTTMLNQARTSLPGLTIYAPDFFTLLQRLVAQPGNYGFINATSDAIDDGYTDLSGAGANYLFWDYLDPTAKAHEVMADTVQQIVSPVRIRDLTWLNGSNRLDLVNIPSGLNGFVEGRTNVVSGSWRSVTNFNSTSATRPIFVSASGPRQTYRLRFPFAWSWP
jgi:outer membrane lipase/esterase